MNTPSALHGQEEMNELTAGCWLMIIRQRERKKLHRLPGWQQGRAIGPAGCQVTAGHHDWLLRLPGHSRAPRFVAWVARSQLGSTITCRGCQMTHADSEATKEAYASTTLAFRRQISYPVPSVQENNERTKEPHPVAVLFRWEKTKEGIQIPRFDALLLPTPPQCCCRKSSAQNHTLLLSSP